MQVERSAFPSLCTTKIAKTCQSGATSVVGVQSGSGMCSSATIWPDRPRWDVVLSKLAGIQSPVYLYIFLLPSSYRLWVCVGGLLSMSHCKDHMGYLVISRKEHQAVIIEEKLMQVASTSNETQEDLQIVRESRKRDSHFQWVAATTRCNSRDG